MRNTRLEKEYSYHIYNLKQHYKHRNDIADKADTLELVKSSAWRKAIKRLTDETSQSMMTVVKHVYIIQDKNLTAAANLSLYYASTQARKLVRKWFETLDRYFFEEIAKNWQSLEENETDKSIL